MCADFKMTIVDRTVVPVQSVVKVDRKFCRELEVVSVIRMVHHRWRQWGSPTLAMKISISAPLVTIYELNEG